MQAKDLIVLGSSRLLGKLYCGDIDIGGSASISTISSALSLTNTTDSSSTTTGALKVSGGVGIAKKLYVGGNTYHSGATYFGSTYNINSSGQATLSQVKVGTGSGDTTITNNSATIANITSTEIKATNVNVTNKLYALKYDLESVADLGGSFIVAPTLIVPNSTQATDNNASLTVAKSGTTLTLTIKDPSISTNQIAGFTWTQNYKVKVSGKISNTAIGTCTGKITSTNLSSTQMTLSVTCDSNIASQITAGSYQIANYNLNIMLYNADTSASGETLPIGIWLQSYGLTKNPTIEIWNGQMTTPKVRLGYLNGIVYDKKDTTTNPNGLNQTLGNIWGLYADNAYLEGRIVAKGGRIGGWTIGDGYITSNSNRTTYNATTAGITINKDGIGAGNGSLNTFYLKHSDGSMMVKKGSIAGWRIESSYLASGTATAPAEDTILLSPSGTSSPYNVGGKNQSGWVLTAGTTFGVDKTGGLYASNANITGEITASKLTINSGATIGGDGASQILNSEIEVGGRNLLLGTISPVTWTISLNSSNYAIKDCYKTYSPVPSIFVVDDLVTISFDWSTTATGGSFHLECGTGTPYVWGTVVEAVGTRNTTSNYVDISSSNTSGHCRITFKITSAVVSAANTLQWLRIRVDGADTSGKTFTISNAKAERGNKATDWSPAPEDVDNKIDSIEIGGNNLIPMSLNLRGCASDNTNGYSSVVYTDNDVTIENIASSTTLSYGVFYDIDVESGETYTLSVMVSNIVGDAVCGIGDKTANTSLSQWTGIGSYISMTNGRYIRTFTIPNTCNRIRLYLAARNSGSKVTLSKLQFEKGNVATDWSAYNEDFVSGGRNLILNSGTEGVSPASTGASTSSNGSAYITPAYKYTDFGKSILNNTTDIFTYSFDYEVTGNSASNAFVYGQMFGSVISNVVAGVSTKPINAEPIGKYYCAFRLTSDQASATSGDPGIRLRNASDGAILKVRNVKLEQGVIPTFWTVAPEDVNDSEYIAGTQTASTRFWTGNTSISELKDGLQITYWLPYATKSETAESKGITAAELNPTETITTAYSNTWLKLTLANGTTTDWIPCYYNGTTRLTTHYGANNIVRLTYKTNVGSIAAGWWSDANYNTNDVDRKRINNNVIVRENITQYCIAGYIIPSSGTAGYRKLVSGSKVDLSYPIAYLSQANISGQSYAVASNGVTTNFYTAMPSVSLRNTKSSWTGTQYAMCYIKGTVSGNIFTIHSDIFTTTIPSTEDNFYYIPIGILYSTYQVNFDCKNQLYVYKDGAFGPVSLREASAAAKTATNCITEISNAGIWVTPSGKKPDANGDVIVGSTTGTLINVDGVGIYKDGNCVAKYGESVTIGNDSDESDSPYIYIDNNDFTVFDSNHAKAFLISSDGALLTTEKRIRKTLEISTYSDSFNNPTTQTVTIDCATINLPTGSNYNAAITFSFYGKHKNANDNSWQFFKEGNSVKIEDIKNAGSSGLNMQIPYQDHSNFWGINFIYNSQSQIITVITSMSSTGQQYMKQIFVTLNYYFYTETTESLTPYCSIGSRKEDTTLGAYSITGGYDIEASGNYSQSFGCGTIAQGKYQTVIGSYNLPQGANNSIERTNFVFIIGNGSENDRRTNAFAIDWNGTAHLRSIRSIRPSYANPCSDGDAYEEILVGNMTNRALTIYPQPVDIAAWISAAIIAICLDYPHKVQAIFKGRLVPNSAAYFEICIYDTSTTARAYDYMPQYAYGVYRQWPNAYWIVWVDNYVFHYKAL